MKTLPGKLQKHLYLSLSQRSPLAIAHLSNCQNFRHFQKFILRDDAPRVGLTETDPVRCTTINNIVRHDISIYIYMYIYNNIYIYIVYIYIYTYLDMSTYMVLYTHCYRWYITYSHQPSHELIDIHMPLPRNDSSYDKKTCTSTISISQPSTRKDNLHTCI